MDKFLLTLIIHTKKIKYNILKYFINFLKKTKKNLLEILLKIKIFYFHLFKSTFNTSICLSVYQL